MAMHITGAWYAAFFGMQHTLSSDDLADTLRRLSGREELTPEEIAAKFDRLTGAQ